MQFLQNPIWQFIINVGVALITGIGSVVISFLVFKRQENQREISYEIISNSKVLVAGELKDKIQISFNNQPVSNLQIVVLKIRNSGNTPIIPRDFAEPLRIAFGKGMRVLDAEVIEMSPKKSFLLKDLLIQKPDSIELEPFLLNSKSSIEIKMLLDGEVPDIRVSSRIFGVEKIKQLNRKSEQQKYANLSIPIGWLTADLLLAFAVIFLAANANTIRQGNFSNITYFVVLTLVVTVFTAIFISMIVPFIISLIKTDYKNK